MKLVTLGTSAMVPTVERNHSANLLIYKNEGILVDCGEGTQRQFRYAKLKPTKITRLFITHWHGDHILGLPGLFQTLQAMEYTKTLHIYGPKGTKQYIKKLFDFFVPSEKMIKHEVHEVKDGVVLETPEFTIESKKLDHNPLTYGYRFKEKDKLRIKKDMLKKYKIKGKIIKDLQEGKDIVWEGKKLSNKKMTYGTKGKVISFVFDTGYCENAIKLAKDADILLIESSLGKDQEEKAKKWNHLTSEMAAKIAKKAKVKKMILTHISQRYKTTNELVKQAKKIFPKTVVAKDLQVFEL